MAKAPRVGEVKTRLAAEIGDKRAAELCEAFLRDTWDNLPRVENTTRAFFFAPADSREFFETLAPDALLLPQPETSFGERVQVGFQDIFELGAERVILVGGDTPHLTASRIEEGFSALDSDDVVLGPCTDGGYYLIGMKTPNAALFEGIAWSTPDVLAQTRAHAIRLGCRCHELSTSFDVDDADDLRRLHDLLKRDPGLSQETARSLGC